MSVTCGGYRCCAYSQSLVRREILAYRSQLADLQIPSSVHPFSVANSSSKGMVRTAVGVHQHAGTLTEDI